LYPHHHFSELRTRMASLRIGFLLNCLVGIVFSCLAPPHPITTTTTLAPNGAGQLDAGTSLTSQPCGLEDSGSARGVMTKLAGGQAIAATKFPWYVMVNGPGYLASGSIISPNYVLTCSHCLPSSGEVTVRAEWNTGSPQDIKSSKYWKHPDVDIGIIELPRPLEFSSTIGPICLSRETAAKGDQTTVLGWHRGEGGLLVGEAERVPISNCSPGEGYLVCFNSKESNGRATEGGDSGGVLMMQEKSGSGRWIQVGVHAYVVNAYVNGNIVESHFKAVRVSSYLDWILATTGLVE